MSVFKVQLNNTQQGLLDLNPSTGGQMSPSIQRTVYIMGPQRINRKLVDGQQFTDVNYYKRFCYPQVPLDQAILSVVTDDGSLWVDSQPALATFPKVFTLAPVINSVTGGQPDTTASGFAANNVVDFMGTFGSAANFIQLNNTGSVSLKVRFNGDVNAVMDLASSANVIYDAGDMTITKIEFGDASGVTAGAVQVTASVLSLPNS